MFAKKLRAFYIHGILLRQFTISFVSASCLKTQGWTYNCRLVYIYAYWCEYMWNLTSLIGQWDRMFENRCWGEYLDLRGRKWQDSVENCIIRSFIICSIHKLALRLCKQSWWDWQHMQHERGEMPAVFNSEAGSNYTWSPSRRWRDLY
jgi:hypothetical protein